jgi:hypothetical protein
LTILAVSLLVSILLLTGLIAWLVLQLKQAGKESLNLAERALELMKAASVEEHVRAQIIRGREGLYQKQLEDALAAERLKGRQPKDDVGPELIEVIDDNGKTREVDFSKLEAIGPDDLLNLS